MASNWYAAASAYLGGFPRNYLVVDTETQGLNVDSPSVVPVQLGYALVVDGVCVDHGDYLVDWTQGAGALSEPAFRSSLEDVRAAMARKGKPYHVDWDSVRDHGMSPEEAMGALGELVVESLDSGYEIVGHNGYSFDRPLLQHWWRRLGAPLDLPGDRFVDTGLMEKCYRMGWAPPLPGSCPRRYWYNKLAEAKSSVRWSLDAACVPAYELAERHGLDMTAAHSAGFDCYVTHLLLESMRERSLAGASSDYQADLSQYVFPIGKLKGQTLQQIAESQQGLDTLRWFLRQEFFRRDYGGLAATVDSFVGALPSR